MNINRFEKQVAKKGNYRMISRMSAAEIIAQIKGLPPAEKAEVIRFVVEENDSWIPDEFKQAMEDVEKGRVVDMDTALRETPPPRLQ